MRTATLIRLVAVAGLAAVSLGTIAQAQNQSQNQQQTQQQTQQAQPQKKKGFWQKIKESAAQSMQNGVQQGTDAAQGTVQQGTNAAQGAMQQGTSAVQNGSQQMQNTAQQGMQGVQQGAFSSNQGPSAFGGGGGAGACGPTCFDAGPFQANVAQMTLSQQGAWHIIRMNIQFHNATNQPLIIAYKDGSMVMVDNNGATYQAAGGQPGALQGMGIDRGNQTDSQFVLGPGQTGNALFSTARYRDQTSPVGTAYSYNFSIDELQSQNGAMAIPVRAYSVNFPSLAPTTVGGNAAFASAPAPATGYNNGKASSVGAGVMRPQGATQAVPAAQPRMVNSSVANRAPQAVAPSTQQRMVNAPAANARAGTVSNAGMRAPVAATPAAKPAAAVRPVPVTTKTAPKKTAVNATADTLKK